MWDSYHQSCCPFQYGRLLGYARQWNCEIRAARDHDGASICALTPEWEERLIKTSVALGTMEAIEYVRRIDRTGQIADPSGGKIQKAATTLLCDTTQKRDFAFPIATRASKILGPISGHLMAQIIPMIRNAAQAFRSWLAVGILQLLCKGMCTAKRFHVENTLAEWDASMNQLVFLTSTSVLSSQTSLSQFEETLGSTFEETGYSTTSSLKPHLEAFNVE